MLEFKRRVVGRSCGGIGDGKEAISIYSVIIQTEESMASSVLYRSLFTDAVRKGTVGFCRWNKLGRDIDEALPDIRELTDDKDEWTAVVICWDPAQITDITESAQNPYDFVTDSPEGAYSESGNTLIRLTHMLGGVPAAGKEFEETIIEEPFRQPRMVYRPVDNPDNEEAHHALARKYEFDGVRPKSIILITARTPWRDAEDTTGHWKSYTEVIRSEFWKRNRYPSITRFVVFDFVRQGPVRREADLFRFWLSVRILSTNTMDSSSLQAYRLYSVDAVIDREKMAECLQMTVNRLASTREAIRREEWKENRGRMDLHADLPEIHREEQVFYELPKNALKKIPPESFRMLSESISDDIGVWDNRKKQVEKALSDSVKRADRALDQKASGVRDDYTFDEHEVSRLDRYQREDLELETGQWFRDVIQRQGTLPSAKVASDEETEACAGRVREYLRRRVTSKAARWTILAGILIILCAQIPAVVQLFHREPIVIGLIAKGAGTFVAALLLSAALVLFIQMKILQDLIKDFNRRMQILFERIQKNTEIYSKYLSAIVSHSRGRSYLDISALRDEASVSLRNTRYRHLDAIGRFLTWLEGLGSSFHLDVDFEKPEISDYVPFTISIPPADNEMYSLDTEITHEAEFNHSGMKVECPFSFVTRLELVREELYDDVK